MTLKQLSVFVENKKGRLAAITKKMADNGIDIRVLSLADTDDFGILRLIVDDNDKAKTVLNEAGIIVKITDVIAVVMSDCPGGAAEVLNLMAENDVSVEYMYACAGSATGKALMIFRTDNSEKAEKLLSEKGYDKTRAEDIYRI